MGGFFGASKKEEAMADEFINSKAWEEMRRRVLERDMHIDRIKWRYGKKVPAEVVHHIMPREFFPEFRLEPWNLISVSKATHDGMHDRLSHRLTDSGWELLQRTMRKNNIRVEEERLEQIKPRPPRGRQNRIRGNARR